MVVRVMTGRQRLTFLGIAAAIAVVAVILLASGGDETEPSANSARTPTPTATDGEATPTATPTPTPTPKPPPLLQAGSEQALTFEQELQAERGLSHARVAVDEVKAITGEAAAQHFVEAPHAGCDELAVFVHRGFHCVALIVGGCRQP